MKFNTIFFDLDDTLYPWSSGLWLAIKKRMNDYMREKLAIPEADIPRLREYYYMTYGATTRGLQIHHNIDTADFLAFVHDLPLEKYLTPDANQREVIASLPTRKVIFTNADIPHARRVLTALNLLDLFDDFVDVNRIAPYCKPQPEAFALAMQIAGETNPAACVMIDDLPRTTRAARQAGMFSILFNQKWTAEDAHAQLTRWDDLPQILEEQ